VTKDQRDKRGWPRNRRIDGGEIKPGTPSCAYDAGKIKSLGQGGYRWNRNAVSSIEMPSEEGTVQWIDRHEQPVPWPSDRRAIHDMIAPQASLGFKNAVFQGFKVEKSGLGFHLKP
jgi:hypothetical protein